MSASSKKAPPAAPKDDGQGEGPAWDEGTPGARIEKSQTASERYEDFVHRVNERADEIASMLPSTITRQKFINAAIAAIKRDPGILNASPRSFMVAVTEAAQDGLIPDGKEGVINVYKGTAKWIPMIGGIRKRARELDRLMIDAQVVYKGDKFVWRQGDDPAIEHEPAQLGTSRGDMIGAYAIFKREDGDILHREVMDRQQIMDVKSQSKQPDGLLWGKFETEAWRKTVARRGFKTTPVSDNLMQIVTRDDDQFEFNNRHESLPAPKPRREPPPAPSTQAAKVITHNPGQVLVEEKLKEPEPVEIIRDKPPVETRTIHQDGDKGADEVYAEFRRDAYAELAQCDNEPAVEELRERILGDLKAGDIQSWKDSCAERAEQVFGH